MKTDTSDRGAPDTAVDRSRLVSRISRLELIVAAGVAVVLAVLIAAEPDILEAPFENARTVAFTVGGTAAAALAFVIMLRFRVRPVVRVLVLGVPFVAVSWWLISPFFIDDVVDEEFVASIADPTASGDMTPDQPSDTPAPPVTDQATPPASVAPPSGPVLLGAGQIVGLAGHEGTGDAGFFALDDQSLVLRMENLDIQNGPDLRLYVVAGAGRTDPGDGSLYLGELRGNVGNLTYDLPADFVLTPGDWTVLVWCEAFSVEFVAATVTVA
jgi:hypothetical protein